MSGGPRSPAKEVATEASAEQKERFRALASDQLPRLYGLARRLVGDEAEDAVQDCLLKAFRGFGRLDDAAAAPAWLTSILVNAAQDWRHILQALAGCPRRAHRRKDRRHAATTKPRDRTAAAPNSVT